MARRTIVWVKEGDLGAEFADVTFLRSSLSAAGTAIGSKPVPYRLDYTLKTTRKYLTTRLNVSSRGDNWWRRLELRRGRSGKWTARGSAGGRVELSSPGGDMTQLEGALDCDLALSPLTNSMPVLRHGLLEKGGPLEFSMAWVSVPDLHVYPSGQRYTFIRKDDGESIIRYESSSRDFIADLSFDKHGLCLRYPGIGHAV